MFRFGWIRRMSAPGGDYLTPAEYFSALPRLETERLSLRPLCRKDACDIYAYASDPEVARYVLWEPHKNLSDTRAYIRYVRGLYLPGRPGSWAVTLSDSGRVIGTIGAECMEPGLCNGSASSGHWVRLCVPAVEPPRGPARYSQSCQRTCHGKVRYAYGMRSSPAYSEQRGICGCRPVFRSPFRP